MRTERFRRIWEILGSIDPNRFASVLWERGHYERKVNASRCYAQTTGENRCITSVI